MSRSVLAGFCWCRWVIRQRAGTHRSFQDLRKELEGSSEAPPRSDEAPAREAENGSLLANVQCLRVLALQAGTRICHAAAWLKLNAAVFHLT